MGVAPMIAMGLGTAASMIQQGEAAQNQADNQAAMNEAKVAATIENYKQLDKAEGDIAYNTAQDGLDLQIQALEAQASQEAFSSATGIRGRSVDMVNSDLARRKANSETDLLLSREQQLSNISAQAESMRIGTEASLDHSKIQKPSILQAGMTGLQLASSVNGLTGKVGDAVRDSSKVGSKGLDPNIGAGIWGV